MLRDKFLEILLHKEQRAGIDFLRALDDVNVRLVDIAKHAQHAWNSVPAPAKVNWKAKDGKPDRIQPVLDFLVKALGEEQGRETLRRMDLEKFCKLEDQLKAGRQPKVAPLKQGTPEPPKINWHDRH
jgi:hypothetical protein